MVILPCADSPIARGSHIGLRGMMGTKYSYRKRKRFARAIGEAKLQLRAASRRLAAVKDVSVQCVHELVAPAHRSVLDMVRTAHHVLPARQVLANAFAAVTLT
jgi:hypothetical protein